MRRARGFTLIEVMVALIVVAIGLAALMVAVSGAARTSGYLRDKTLAQWIALNRVSEARLATNQFAPSTDVGEVTFANRTWHYDTQYFNTSITTMQRIVVRVYSGPAKDKGRPLVEATGFRGTALATPGNSNAADWTRNSGPNATAASSPGTPGNGNGGAASVQPGGAVTPPGTTTTPAPTGTSLPPTQ